MRAVRIGILLGIGFAAGTVAAQTSNWLVEFVTLRSLQTEVVRDAETGLHYLCWDGDGQRSGAKFDHRKAYNALRSIGRGERQPLAGLFANDLYDWSDEDDEVCWGEVAEEKDDSQTETSGDWRRGRWWR